MASYQSRIFVVALISLGGCTETAGDLVTQDKFSFPNSDVFVDKDDSNVAIDVSRTFFIWQNPPLAEIHDQAIADVMKSGKGTMLINTKWVTNTTVYPFPVPIYSYRLHMEGTLAKADVFQKKLH